LLDQWIEVIGEGDGLSGVMTSIKIHAERAALSPDPPIDVGVVVV
jgi:hypothetical protein